MRWRAKVDMEHTKTGRAQTSPVTRKIESGSPGTDGNDNLGDDSDGVRPWCPRTIPPLKLSYIGASFW